MWRTFSADWDVVSTRLERLIGTYHAKDQGQEPLEQYTVRVRDALFEEWRVIYGSFDYYAALSSMDHELTNVYAINMRCFISFVKTCNLTSQALSKAMFELMFIKSHTVADKDSQHASDKFNRQRHLNRQQWMQVLVRVAVERHPKVAQRHVAEAVSLLFREDLAPRLPPGAHHHSDSFREHFCYLEKTDAVLRKHKESLR